MEELLACRVCLATDNAKLYSFFKFQLAQAYEVLTGSQVLVSDGLPQHICSYCSALLLKSVTFREKCINSQDLLKYCLNEQSELSMGYIRSIKREITALILPYSVTSYGPMNVTDDGEVSVKEEDKESDVLTDMPAIAAFDIKYEDDAHKKRKRKKKGKEKKNHFNIVTIKCEDNQDIEIHETNNQFELDNDYNNFNDDTIESEADNDDINDEGIVNTDLKHVEIVNLSKQEQLGEIEARKASFNYTNSAYKCDKCYKGFITESTFRNHMQRHDPKNGAHECEICFSRWPEPRSLRAHVLNSHRRKFICKLCDFVSRSNHRAREHCKWHQGFKFICKICGASFAKSTSHLTHIRLQHPSNHSCDVCGESFIGEFGLRIHKKRAHRDQDITRELSVCNNCNTEFVSLEALKRHIECSTDGLCDAETRACGQCGEGFQSEDQLAEHAKEHQTAQGDRVHCDDCKRSFTSEKSYSVHYQRVHLGVKLQKRKRQTLKRPDEPVVCEICGRRCITMATLRYHQRIHTGERPFHCTECPKKFSVFQRLQIHLRTHTGESPYKCKHCPKAFKHKAALNRHDRVHTGAKPYTCSHCGKGFSQSNSMKLHVNTVHLKLPAPYRARRNKN